MKPLPAQPGLPFAEPLPRPSAPSGCCPLGCRTRPEFVRNVGKSDRWRCPACTLEFEVLDTRIIDGRGGGH